MVNVVELQKPLLRAIMKMAGLVSQTVEVEKGTYMHFWVPKSRSTKKSKKSKPLKPVVVLVHGFAAEGMTTWQFQVGSLSKKFDVFVPDLLFFGESFSILPGRTPEFQARCLVTSLRILGVDQCGVVGFSYGGMVASVAARQYPDLVKVLVISGSVPAMTDSLSETLLNRLGFKSSKELLLPKELRGIKALLRVACYKNIWLPDKFHRDFLEVMFNNRKEREELLEALEKSNKEGVKPRFSQNVLMLWGDKDEIFNVELARTTREQLGDKAMFESIKKAGHLVHLERPCAYNRKLKKFLVHCMSVTVMEIKK